jgi:hypothetical protein
MDLPAGPCIFLERVIEREQRAAAVVEGSAYMGSKTA